MIYKLLTLCVVLCGCQSTTSNQHLTREITVPVYGGSVKGFGNHKKQTLVTVTYPTKKLLNYLSRNGDKAIKMAHEHNIVLGVTEHNNDDSINCNIYLERKPVDANDSEYFYTLGHELYHCLKGSFH